MQYPDVSLCSPQDTKTLMTVTDSSVPRPFEMGVAEARAAPHLEGHSPASPEALRWGPGAAAAQVPAAPLLALHLAEFTHIGDGGTRAISH